MFEAPVAELSESDIEGIDGIVVGCVVGTGGAFRSRSPNKLTLEATVGALLPVDFAEFVNSPRDK